MSGVSSLFLLLRVSFSSFLRPCVVLELSYTLEGQNGRTPSRSLNDLGAKTNNGGMGGGCNGGECKQTIDNLCFTS